MHRAVSCATWWSLRRLGRSIGRAVAVGLVALSLGAARTQAAATPTNAVPTLTLSDAFKSVFIDDPKFGKDPFFPKSTRRQPVATVSTPKPTTPAPSGALRVRGLSVANGRRLVIINTVTFAEGDEATIKVNNQPVRVKCVQIGDQSVLVHVNDVPTELPIGLR